MTPSKLSIAIDRSVKKLFEENNPLKIDEGTELLVWYLKEIRDRLVDIESAIRNTNTKEQANDPRSGDRS